MRALVAVDRALDSLDRPFTYRIPEELAGKLTPGQWVKVPFGHSMTTGCYLGIDDSQEPPAFKLKPIVGILESIPPLPADLIALARWMASRYVCTFVQALRLLLPTEARRETVRKLKVNAVRLAVSPEEALKAAEAVAKRAPARARLLRLLAEVAPDAVPLAELERKDPSARGAVAGARKSGLIEQVLLSKRRDPFRDFPITPPPHLTLTTEQEEALSIIRKAYQSAAPKKPVLLHGVTGSGKTEVYIRAIREVIQDGKQAIVLVPEIALTPQLVARFRSRFGERIAVLHSALSAGERFDEWLRIRGGEVDVVIGARSAVFAPCERLGLIILDEEHENTYKQAETPTYHARDVAEKRAELTGALVILGSATPSVETYFRAERGEIWKASMSSRVHKQAMPKVEIVDMKAELQEGNRSIFSRALVRALARVLERGEQAILFLNRRGHSTYVFCRSCGEAVQCPACDITLTYHMPKPGQPASQWLSCHHCGHRTQVPQLCPNCGSPHIRFLGAGTERIEAEVLRLFPKARVVRMDSDTTRHKGAHAHMIRAFEKGEYDILIGTQMVAKGLDIPRVTLVAAVLADTTLNIPDIWAAERTFQLLEQVGGRAGRADRPGYVILQTYKPDNYAIQAAAEHDYIRFYREEIRYRSLLENPPFSTLIRLLFSGPAEADVATLAHDFHHELQKRQDEAFTLLGPVAAPIARIQGHYRYHLFLKGRDLDQMALAVRETMRMVRWDPDQIKVFVDVEPRHFL